MGFQLSILIPSITSRADSLELLVAECDRQSNGLPVQVIECVTPHCNDGGINIPTKRNFLYGKAAGKYSVQIDDDDMILPGYIEKVLEAIEVGADCVTHDIRVIEPDDSITSARVSIEYDDWFTGDGEYKYKQAPYFKVPILTTLCRRIPVNTKLNMGEDHDFMKRIYPLLNSEAYINAELYEYRCPPIGSNAKVRYG